MTLYLLSLLLGLAAVVGQQPGTDGLPRAPTADGSHCLLSVAGVLHPFDSCPQPSNDSPFSLFLSFWEDADGGTVVRGGLRAEASEGWVGWGLGTGRMFGSRTAIVKADPQAPTGATVQGIVIPRSYDSKSINAAAGSWQLSDATAALENGHLVAAFTATLPSSLVNSPLPYVWASGQLNSGGGLSFHFDYGVGELFLPPPSQEVRPAREGTRAPSVPAGEQEGQEPVRQPGAAAGIAVAGAGFGSGEVASGSGGSARETARALREEVVVETAAPGLLTAGAGGLPQRREGGGAGTRMEDSLVAAVITAATPKRGAAAAAKPGGEESIRTSGWVWALGSWVALCAIVYSGSRLARQARKGARHAADAWPAWQRKDPAHEV